MEIKDKTILITGASDGIGKETALRIAAHGTKIILVGRNEEKTKGVVNEIVKTTNNEKVDYFIADLSDQNQVRVLAEKIKEKYSRLEILFNNAGATFRSWKLTSDDIERTFALNHLSYFLMTYLLMDLIKESGPARIINTSSSGHRTGVIHFDNLNLEKEYSLMKAYRQSKLGNVMFTYELARKMAGTEVTVNALHPGLVKTNIGIPEWGLIGKLLKPVIFRNAISVEGGSKTSIYLIESDEVEKVSGKYFYKSKEMNTNEASYIVEDQKRLWEVSEGLTGVHWE